VEVGDVPSDLVLDSMAPVGFIFLRGKTETLRFATDNAQCFPSLLSNPVACVFLLRVLGNLFQQPFPARRRIVTGIARKKGFQALQRGHVSRPCGEAAAGGWMYKWRSRGKKHVF